MLESAEGVEAFYKQEGFKAVKVVFVDPWEHTEQVLAWSHGGFATAPRPLRDPSQWPQTRLYSPIVVPDYERSGPFPPELGAGPAPEHLGFTGSVTSEADGGPMTSGVLAQIVYMALQGQLKQFGDEAPALPPLPPAVLSSLDLAKQVVRGDVRAVEDPAAAALLRQGADIDRRVMVRKHKQLLLRESSFLAPVHVAARECNTMHLRRLASFGAAVDTRDELGRTVLHHVTGLLGGNTPMDSIEAFVETAVHLGADPNAQDRIGLTPCAQAIFLSTASMEAPAMPEDDSATFQLTNRFNYFCALLWQHGADLNIPDDFGQTPLVHAARARGPGSPANSEFLDWAIADPDGPSVNPHIVTIGGNTALTFSVEGFSAIMTHARHGINLAKPEAIAKGSIIEGASHERMPEHELLVRALKPTGGDAPKPPRRHLPDEPSSTGVVSYGQVARRMERRGSLTGQLEDMLVACGLLPFDFDLEEELGENGEAFGDVDYSDLYAAAQASLDAAAASWSARTAAAAAGSESPLPQWDGDSDEYVRQLSSLALDGEPLKQTARRLGLIGSPGLAKTPCGINDINAGGNSLLQGATRSNSGTLVRLALAAGADPSLAVRSGMTALHYAASHGYGAAVRALLQSRNTDVALLDSYGRTATQLALSHGYVAVACAIRASALLRGSEAVAALHAAEGTAEWPGWSEEDLERVEAVRELGDDAWGVDVLALVPAAALAAEAESILAENGYRDSSGLGSVSAAAGADLFGLHMGKVGSHPSLKDVASSWASGVAEVGSTGEAGLAAGVGRGSGLAHGPRNATEPFRTLLSQWDAIVPTRSHEAADDLEASRGDATPYCEVDVVDVSEMTTERLADHVQLGRPVLIKNGVNASWDLRAFSPANLSALYGGHPGSLAGIPYSAQFGQQRLMSPIFRWIQYTKTGDVRFLQQMGPTASTGGGVSGPVSDLQQGHAGRDLQRGRPPNFFDGWDHKQYPLYLTDNNDQAPWLGHLGSLAFMGSEELLPAQYQLFSGPPMTGAPIHYHLHALNLAITGRKRWFILPPRDAVYSGTQIRRWFEHERQSMHSYRRPLECVQEAGDAFYVPMGWAHGVLNLRFTIAVAIEFAHKARGGEGPLLASLPDGLEAQQRQDLRSYAEDRMQAPIYA